jgi:CDP-diacylglycerol--glycerol-3-phosphate 3-phosphatidyltransferase
VVFNLPNTLTGFRILAVPLVAIVFYLPVPWSGPASCFLFALAGITDWLDGYLARRFDQTSNFGAFLDPVADKLIVSTALILLLQRDPSLLNTAIAAVIIGREITVSALREWMSELGARAHVSVTFFAKWKTTVQIFGISFMLFQQPFLGLPIYEIGIGMMLIAATLTIWSMLDYLKAAWPIMRGQG